MGEGGEGSGEGQERGGGSEGGHRSAQRALHSNQHLSQPQSRTSWPSTNRTAALAARLPSALIEAAWTVGECAAPCGVREQSCCMCFVPLPPVAVHVPASFSLSTCMHHAHALSQICLCVAFAVRPEAVESVAVAEVRANEGLETGGCPSQRPIVRSLGA